MSYRLTDGIEFLKSLPDQSVDGIFTDPPWGSGADIQGQEQWRELIWQMTTEAPRILKPGGRVLIWMGVRMIAKAIRSVNGLEYRWSVFVQYMPPSYTANFQRFMDQILYFARSADDPWPKKQHGKAIPQIYFKASRGKPDTLHPCARPITTLKEILSDWFEVGEYIVDPFAGSDTLGVACRDLSLKYDTCEIDPLMYATGLARNAQQNLFV